MGIKQKKQEKVSATSGSNQGNVAVASADASPSKVQALGKYFVDARFELGKVSWPTKKEVRATGLAVLALVVVMCIFLGVADIFIAKIIELILSVGL